MKSAVWLTVAVGLPGALASLTCYWGLVSVAWEVPAVATLIVLVPALASHAVLLIIGERSPEVELAVILLGSFFRMGGVLAGGLGAFYWVSAVGERPLVFVSWALVFYLVSLAVEVALGLRLARVESKANP